MIEIGYANTGQNKKKLQLTQSFGPKKKNTKGDQLNRVITNQNLRKIKQKNK